MPPHHAVAQGRADSPYDDRSARSCFCLSQPPSVRLASTFPTLSGLQGPRLAKPAQMVDLGSESIAALLILGDASRRTPGACLPHEARARDHFPRRFRGRLAHVLRAFVLELATL